MTLKVFGNGGGAGAQGVVIIHALIDDTKVPRCSVCSCSTILPVYAAFLQRIVVVPGGIMKSRILAATVSCLVLASCGADGSDTSTPPPTGSTPTPTTSPSPSPSPTATPTPIAIYAGFEESSNGSKFASACSTYIFGNPMPQGVTMDSGLGLAIGYDTASSSYTVGAYQQSYTFGPADADPNVTPPAKIYFRRVNGVLNQTFQIARPSPTGIALMFARFASLNNRVVSAPYDMQCAIGVRTQPFDLPKATASFSRNMIAANGYLCDEGKVTQYLLSPSVVNTEANFAAKTVTVRVALVAQPLPGVTGPNIQIGMLTGTGAIDLATGVFTGSWTSDDALVRGSFIGAFYGPQAQEYGLSFSIGRQGPSGQPDASSVGTMFGTR